VREASSAPRTPEHRRSATASDGAEQGGQRHAVRPLPCCNWPKQASCATRFITNQGRAEHSRSNRAPGKSGGNHRTQHSGYHSWQPRDLAAVISKPCNLPRPDAAEPAWGKAVVHAAPAPGAVHDAQGPQPARSRVSLRISERVDPLKDNARHRLNLLANSKLDEKESSTGPICFGPQICNELFPPKFTLPWDMPKYIRAVKPED
jgi:hypothetical protein